MNSFDEDREREFFAWFDTIQQVAERHDVSIYTVVNARQIWDIAYAKGVAQNKRENKED
jgi:hypothetical protein